MMFLVVEVFVGPVFAAWPSLRSFTDGYIVERSGHSRGSTVDLTLVRLTAGEARPTCQASR